MSLITAQIVTQATHTFGLTWNHLSPEQSLHKTDLLFRSHSIAMPNIAILIHDPEQDFVRWAFNIMIVLLLVSRDY